MASVAGSTKRLNTCVPWFADADWSLQPEGVEGLQLGHQADEAFDQWVQQAQVLIATVNLSIAGDDDEQLSYAPVPPNRTFYVKTRYVFVGRREPLPFTLDDE